MCQLEHLTIFDEEGLGCYLSCLGVGRSVLVQSRVSLSIRLPLFWWRLRSNWRLSRCGHRLVSRASLPNCVLGLPLVSVLGFLCVQKLHAGCALDLFQGSGVFVDLEPCSSILHASTMFYST